MRLITAWLSPRGSSCESRVLSASILAGTAGREQECRNVARVTQPQSRSDPIELTIPNLPAVMVQVRHTSQLASQPSISHTPGSSGERRAARRSPWLTILKEGDAEIGILLPRIRSCQTQPISCPPISEDQAYEPSFSEGLRVNQEPPPIDTDHGTHFLSLLFPCPRRSSSA